MEIHKPKPWHGVREFLKEYVIIVVGVLTALALEQTVEWLHWREQVRAAEDALLPEIRSNLLNSYERITTMPCLVQRRSELRDRLLDGDRHWAADPDPMFPNGGNPKPSVADVARGQRVNEMRPVYAGPTRPWGDGAYQAALASGIFNHMPREEAAAYARLHRGFDQIKEWQTAEQAARVRLTALAFDTTLTPAEKHGYLNSLGEVAIYDGAIEQTAAQIIRMADKSGFRIRRSDLDKGMASWRTRRGDCIYQPAIPVDAH